MLKKILGIIHFTHNSSATLLINGKIIGCCEEERFTRKKHTNNFPLNSIRYLLKQGNIDSSQIDKIVIPYVPMKNYFSKLFFVYLIIENFLVKK